MFDIIWDSDKGLEGQLKDIGLRLAEGIEDEDDAFIALEQAWDEISFQAQCGEFRPGKMPASPILRRLAQGEDIATMQERIREAHKQARQEMWA
jgi:hypothetical protein